MSTGQQTYIMLGNENLWQVAMQCHHALAEPQIPYSVCGGSPFDCTDISETQLTSIQSSAERTPALFALHWKTWGCRGMNRRLNSGRRAAFPFNSCIQVIERARMRNSRCQNLKAS